MILRLDSGATLRFSLIPPSTRLFGVPKKLPGSVFFLLRNLIAFLCYQTMSTQRLHRTIARIKREIAGLGPLRPGTLYSRYSVCGKPGCRCSGKRKPRKHGPYHYLSYTFEGRSHTEFVSAGQLRGVREEVKNYNKLIKLVKELVTASMKLAQLRKG